MCGITGFLRARGLKATDGDVIARMTAALKHRGPDDGGVWMDESRGVALGHRRLAILDLSSSGRQPMLSPCGRYVLSYNGEVYNYEALRAELISEGVAFRGASDTEVVLALILKHGVKAALSKMRGMFALAFWDGAEDALFLARDRMGEKPVFFGAFGRTFIFGSELKALRRHPDFVGDIDRDVLARYVRYNYVPFSESVYSGISKLPPGSFLRVSVARDEKIMVTEPELYWSLKQVAERGRREKFSGSASEAADELEKLLKAAVAEEMRSDVPLGAFLSGGVDSAMVVALMAALSGSKIRTFTVGFADEDYDEAGDARLVARHLGTEHSELYVTPAEAMAVIAELPRIYDEPFADSSQIPACLVAKFARQNVSVSLSGDGADELFGGYNRYLLGNSVLSRFSSLPSPLQKMAAMMLTSISPAAWDGAMVVVFEKILRRSVPRQMGDKIHKLAKILNAADAKILYESLVSHWSRDDEVVIGARESDATMADTMTNMTDYAPSEMMMLSDAMHYLADDILVKLDRAAMAVGLESRVPFLDHRVVEFAWSLPLQMKIRDGEGKRVLKNVLHKYVPQALVERPKSGFRVPVGAWLRGPLKGWAESLLDETKLKSQGYFNAAIVRAKWREHLSGKFNREESLWSVLMFQQWLECHHA